MSIKKQGRLDYGSLIRNHPIKKVRAIRNFFSLKKRFFKFEH